MNRRSVIALSALLALLGCGGCGEEAETSRPVTETCLVQGAVGQVGPETVARVQLRSDVPHILDRVIVLETDSAGRYRAEVPAGDYEISAMIGWNEYWRTAAGGFTAQRAEAETVRLGPENSPYTADFPFGAMRFRAELPALLDGGRIGVQAFEADTTDAWPMLITFSDVTIVDGRLDLTLRGFPPGAYMVAIDWALEGNHRGEQFWLPAAGERTQAGVYRVGPDSLTNVPIPLTSSPARLSGRVTGVWQAMGTAAPVLRAIDGTGKAVAGPWEVAGDGSFELPLFRPVPVRLEVMVDNVRQWVGGTQLSNATVFMPQAGQVIDGIEVVGGGLRLRALPSDLFDGETGAYFEFYDPVGPTLRFVVSRRLEYQLGFANLYPGDWLVRVTPDPYNRQRWRPQWLDRRVTAAEADILHVPGDGTVLTLDLVLEAGGVIGGRVASAAGAAATHRVVVTPAAVCVNEASDRADDPDGVFAVVGLADGRYRLGAVPLDSYWGGPGGRPPDGTIWYPGTTDWASAQDLVITGAGTVDGLVLDVP